MKISDALLPEFDQEAATTRKVISRVADDKLGFKPHEKSWDMASLASHIASLPSWTVETVTADCKLYPARKSSSRNGTGSSRHIPASGLK